MYSGRPTELSAIVRASGLTRAVRKRAYAVVFCALLVSLIHLPLSDPAMAQIPNIDPNLPGSQSPEIVERLKELAWENHESRQVSELQLQMAKQEIQNRRWEWLDALSLTYNYSPDFLFEEDAGRSSRLGIGVVVRLGNLAQVPGRVRMAKLERAVASSEIDIKRKDIQNQVIQRYAFYLESMERYELYVESVENTYSTVESARQRFERGDMNVDELQRAEDYLTGRRQQLIQARTDFFKARIDVEELIGVPIEQVFEILPEMQQQAEPEPEPE